MTRQNKSLQKAIIARQITAMHLRGEKGPGKTTPCHGKVRTLLKTKRDVKPVTEGTAANQSRNNRDRKAA